MDDIQELALYQSAESRPFSAGDRPIAVIPLGYGPAGQSIRVLVVTSSSNGLAAVIV